MRPRGLPFARGLRRGELVGADTAVALVLLGICMLAAREVPTPAPSLREPLWASWTVAALMAAPLAVRRLWPLPVCAVTLAAAAGALITGIIPDYAAVPATVTVAFAIYMVGLQVSPYASRVAAVTSIGVLIGALLGAAQWAPDGNDATGVTAAVLLIAVGWLAGRITAERRAHQAQIIREETDRAVDAERLRIARELHDVVAHTLSLIAVKASVANHVGEQRPAETRAALVVIEETSRSALSDVRGVLGLLRTTPAAAALTPTPGLGDLPGLVAQTTAAGVHVDLALPAAKVALPDGVGRTIYRIVQESLTNVVNHAGPATSCQARVVVEPTGVVVSIVDDGRGPLPVHARTGHGIIGMRERVALYGGEFSAGPGVDGGFVVQARLPLGAG